MERPVCPGRQNGIDELESQYDKTLDRIADDVRASKPRSATVRELLGWFGAKRRGSWIAGTVRQALSERGLTTNPDFQAVYIDAEVSFIARPERANQAAPGNEVGSDVAAVVVTESGDAVGGATGDPTYRIGNLESANRELVTVSPNDNVQKAVTLMLSRDYSQLPVITSPCEVKGIISWRSIGRRLTVATSSTQVREMMDEAAEVRADRSIFEALAQIARHDYVLIRNPQNNRIDGIVTASDLGQQFRQLAEPFLLIGEIENHLRKVLDGRFQEAELKNCRDPGDSERPIKSIADLTFGEYIRVLEEPERWEKTGLKVDRAAVIKDLNRIRNIRNDVMHFDPDPLVSDDITFLRSYARFWQELSALGAF
jgi:CBS domain-containing protein